MNAMLSCQKIKYSCTVIVILSLSGNLKICVIPQKSLYLKKETFTIITMLNLNGWHLYTHVLTNTVAYWKGWFTFFKSILVSVIKFLN